MTNIVYNTDCMVGLREYPDKYFDLAVVDPPYGINKAFKATSRIRAYGDVHVANDLKPGKEYFVELMRVSKNQIILHSKRDSKTRSKSFPGIARAMAEQWGGLING